MEIKREHWGELKDGTEVWLYTLANDSGMQAQISTYGGTIVSLWVPDRYGEAGDVVLGFETLAEYVDHSPYFGCVVGRYANRIARGRFTLDGVTYQLACNDGPNHLHGGEVGFDKRVWSSSTRESDQGEPVLELSLISPDGDQGYPGTLRVRVSYTLTDANALRIDYEATTDAPTILNLTNHSYFNLSAGQQASVLDHELRLNADRYTPVDDTLIPTGELAPVAGTPLDFRSPRPIGARIEADHSQMQIAGGYDHNFVINGEAGTLRLAARVVDPTSGRVMTVRTTEPGVQLYSANFLPLEGLPGKRGLTYGPRAALCLETQHFPDSPNKPHFPSVILRPGKKFCSTTIYAFGTL